MNEPTIEHQAAQQRFVLTQDNATALLEYQLDGLTINFYHTFVPSEFRGKGLAEQLVRHAINWARTENYQLTASCSYVQRFI